MAKRPDHCPRCGSDSVADILWGMPAFTEELERELEEGKTVLGGCCVEGNDPEWHCKQCGHQWRTSPTIEEWT